MSYENRWQLKQLIDNLNDAQIEQLIETVRASGIKLPGWRDRLLPPRLPTPCPAGGSLSASVSLSTFLRGLRFSRLAAHTSRQDGREGVWLIAETGKLTLAASDDYRAFHFTAPARVHNVGHALLDRRTALKLVETLRKGLPRTEQQTADLHVETADKHSLKIKVDDRGRHVPLLELHEESPELPPLPLKTISIPSAAPLRDAIRVAVNTAERDYAMDSPAEYIGLELQDDQLVLRSQPHRLTHASQVIIEITSPMLDRPLPDVHHSFLKHIEAVLEHGPIQIGITKTEGRDQLLSMRGPDWAAWTTDTAEPAKRYAIPHLADQTTITVKRAPLQKLLTKARALAAASRPGLADPTVQLQIADNKLQLTAPSSSNISHGQSTLPVRAAMPINLRVHIEALLHALQPWPDDTIAIHTVPDTEPKLVYITPPDHQPDEPPSRAIAFMAAQPPDKSTN